jgi:hypothetical protein
MAGLGTRAEAVDRGTRRVEDLQDAIEDKTKVVAELQAEQEKRSQLLQKELGGYKQAQTDVIKAQKRVDDARQKVRDLGQESADKNAQIRQKVDADPQVASALAAANEAQKAYEAARAEALKQAEDTPAFRAAAAKLTSARDRLDRLVRLGELADAMEVAGLRIEVVNAENEVNHAREQALDNVPQYAAARTANDEARKAHADLRLQKLAAAKQDPDLAKVEESIEAARQELLAAQRDLQQAQRTEAAGRPRAQRAAAYEQQIKTKLEREQRLLDDLHNELKLAKERL